MVDQMAGTQVVDQVAGAQVVDQVAGVQVVDQVAGAQVVNQAAGVHIVVNQVAGTQAVDRVKGAVQMAVVILVPFRQTSDSSVTFRLCLTTRMSNSFEPFHPRRWLRVCSPGRAEGGEEMEVVF